MLRLSPAADLPLDGYIRVSRVGGREGDGFISPQIQERAIREWGVRAGLPVNINPPELDRSGGTMDRPIFNEIMARIRAGESGGMVVYKIDRFSRGVIGGITTLAEIGKIGASFASVSEPGLDYTTPQGKAFLHMMFVFAELVRDQATESWLTAVENAVGRGIHMAGYGVFGYDRGPDRRLVPNDDAPIVPEIFRLRGEESWTWNAIATWLDVAAPREAGKGWTGQGVQRLCARRVYLGEAFWSVHQNSEGRAPVVNTDAHLALVTPEAWQRAQMNPAIARGGAGNRSKANGLLAGLVRCAGCRYTMTYAYLRGDYPVYRCRGKYAGGKCEAIATVSADNLDGYLRGTIAEALDGMLAAGGQSDADLQAADALLEEAREDLAGFRADRAARKRLGPAWNDWLDDYVTAVEDAEARVRDLSAGRPQDVELMSGEAFLGLDLEGQQAVAADMLDTVMVRRSASRSARGRHAPPVSTRAYILWRGQAPDDLPRRRVYGGPIRRFDWPDREGEPRVHAA